MPDIYIYICKLDGGIDEAVLPCIDGYTVYIDERLDDEHRRRVLAHALEHIRRGDCAGGDVQLIEEVAHDAAKTS